MPYSATERFSRTYTPRVPDDSYDSLGGADIPDSIIIQLPERPFQRIDFRAGFTTGILAQTIVPAGQRNRFNIAAMFTGGALQTQGVSTPVQADEFLIHAAMAGGTLK
jgi:hypothetical protein